MKKYHACFLYMMLIVLIPSAYAQEMNPWKLLSDVKIENRMDESVGYEISYPVFGEKAKSLNGEIITFKGYMIPYEVYLGPKYFILSALPIAACFFCGGAGPESVMEVFTKEAVTLTSGTIQVKGLLELNPDNSDHMMYILRNAELVE